MSTQPEAQVIEQEAGEEQSAAPAETGTQQIALGQGGSNLPSAVTPDQMLYLAVEKGADIDQLSKLMDLKERWEANEARKAFVDAMSRFKADPPRITKNRRVHYQGKNGPPTDFRHATLDNICDVIGKALSSVGISYRWRTQQDSNLITVTCVLTHNLGHSEETTLSAAPDTTGGKNSIQAVGSAVTYLQRYTLLAATGMATEEQDDDAQGAGNGSQKQQDDGPLTSMQVKQIRDALGRAQIPEQDFLARAKVDSIEDLPQSRFGAAMNSIKSFENKKRSQQ